jgi:PTS system mannose-specific IIA component
MIGLILVTHGRLAEEMRSAMEHVVGPQRRVATVCIGADDDVEQRRQDIRHCIEDVDAGDGVIVLTDMFGGTPSNLALSMMARGGVEVIAGMNLPMLVKLAKIRSRQTLSECTDIAELAGRKYIAAASHVLETCKTPNLCMSSLDPRQPNGHHPDQPAAPVLLHAATCKAHS